MGAEITWENATSHRFSNAALLSSLAYLNPSYLVPVEDQSPCRRGRDGSATWLEDGPLDVGRRLPATHALCAVCTASRAVWRIRVPLLSGCWAQRLDCPAAHAAVDKAAVISPRPAPPAWPVAAAHQPGRAARQRGPGWARRSDRGGLSRYSPMDRSSLLAASRVHPWPSRQDSSRQSLVSNQVITVRGGVIGLAARQSHGIIGSRVGVCSAYFMRFRRRGRRGGCSKDTRPALRPSPCSFSRVASRSFFCFVSAVNLSGRGEELKARGQQASRRQSAARAR